MYTAKVSPKTRLRWFYELIDHEVGDGPGQGGVTGAQLVARLNWTLFTAFYFRCSLLLTATTTTLPSDQQEGVNKTPSHASPTMRDSRAKWC